jgi:acetyl-CoA acetyltransferase family protein
LGTVTAGNSSQITDGAAMLLISYREKAEVEGWPILGYIHDWAYSGCDPERMGMGPVHASHRVLSDAGLHMKDISRVEINEAFAVQVLSNLKAMDSKQFAKKAWGESEAMGAPDTDKLNVHGGAIAMGHPVGMTGARLILTLLRQLKRETGGGLGLASLCIGGGQGGATLVGSEPWQ